MGTFMPNNIIENLGSFYSTFTSSSKVEEAVSKHLYVCCKLMNNQAFKVQENSMSGAWSDASKQLSAFELQQVQAAKTVLSEETDFPGSDVKAWCLSLLNENADRENQILLYAINMVSSVSKEQLQDALCKIFDNPSKDELYGFLTPSCIFELATKLLKFEPSDAVFDICTGSAGFLSNLVTHSKNVNFAGIEIKEQFCLLAKVRADVLGLQVNIMNADVLRTYANKKYDKVFSDFPWELKIDVAQREQFIRDIDNKLEFLSPGTSVDCLFVDKAVKAMKEKGRAVVVVPGRFNFSYQNCGYRKHLISNGMVESVIAMPSGLYSYTKIPVYILVLSYGNQNVRFIDASSEFKKGRRVNTLSIENIENILKMHSEDSSLSISVSNEDVLKNETVNFTPSVYLPIEGLDVAFEMTEFKDYIQSVTTGSNITASQLDELVSKTPTNIRYLQTKDVISGVETGDMVYLKSMDKSWEKSLVKNGDLIISRNAASIRIAVAKINDGEQVVLSANLYAVTLKDGFSSYFFKAFFDSEIGQLVLSSHADGSVVKMLPKGNINELLVPKFSAAEQKDFAQKYLALKEEMAKLQVKIDALSTSVCGLFSKN